MDFITIRSFRLYSKEISWDSSAKESVSEIDLVSLTYRKVIYSTGVMGGNKRHKIQAQRIFKARKSMCKDWIFNIKQERTKQHISVKKKKRKEEKENASSF